MKIISKNICYLILVFLFASCSSSEFIFKKFNEKVNINTNHWVTYKQPKNGKKLLASIDLVQVVKKSTTNDLSIGFNIDSVEIIPKTKIINKEITIKADTSKKINSSSKKEDYNQIKKIEPRSLLSFISGILGFMAVVLSIIEGVSLWGLGSTIETLGLGLAGFISAIILGRSGEEKIKENPKKYKGKRFAKIGKTIGWIGGYLAITALTILLLILLFIVLLFLLF